MTLVTRVLQQTIINHLTGTMLDSITFLKTTTEECSCMTTWLFCITCMRTIIMVLVTRMRIMMVRCQIHILLCILSIRDLQYSCIWEHLFPVPSLLAIQHLDLKCHKRITLSNTERSSEQPQQSNNSNNWP